MTKKILILAGDGVEALEVYYPFYRCIEEGYEATIASQTPKKLHTVVHDFIGWDTYTETQGYLIESHIAFEDVNPADYDGLFVPGGRAPEYIRLHKDIPGIVSHFFEANKPVAALCHGAMVLAMVPQHLKNRELTAYIACKPDVEAAGATYINEGHHEQGNLVSGHAWPDLPHVLRLFLAQLNK